MIDLNTTVIQFLSSKEDPVSIQSILKALGMPQPDRAFLRSHLREMCRRGEVEKHGTKYWVPRGTARSRELKRAKHQKVKGRLSINSRGLGFVSPLDLGTGSLRKGQDWMIESTHMGAAKHGDLVLVDWVGMSRGRVMGKIVKILEFGKKYLSGIIKQEGSTGSSSLVFRPFNSHEPAIPIQRKWSGEVQPGTVVIYKRNGSGDWVFQKAVGNLCDPLVDEEMVLAENGIIHEFPKKVQDEADGMGQNPVDRASNREDFESFNVFTVDGEDARDFDDAIHILEKDHGFELGVHIADVANFVHFGSHCDRHAAVLANSTYLPHKAFPMLPRVLSENLCSLNPGVKRLTLSVIMQLDQKGNLLDFRITKGHITSRNRLTYKQVFQMGIQKDPQVRAEFASVVEDIDLCLKLAGAMRELRFEQGGLDIQTLEPRMIVNSSGMMEKVWGQKSDASNQMIEMFMCLANQTVATYMASLEMDLPFRIHEPPEEKKILEFVQFLASAGVRIPFGLDFTEGHAINRVLDEMKVRSHPDNLAIFQTLMLRSLKRAQYSAENKGHFGLGMNFYCHFTSPIRRYADLIIHQTLTAHFNQQTLPDRNKESLAETCEHLSEWERNSDSAERAFFKVKMLRHLEESVGKVFNARITDVKNFGLIVELDELFVEGLVAIETLDDDYRLNGYALVGQRKRKVYKIGDPVSVRIDLIDLEQRRMDLSFPAKSVHRLVDKPMRHISRPGRKKPVAAKASFRRKKRKPR